MFIRPVDQPPKLAQSKREGLSIALSFAQALAVRVKRRMSLQNIASWWKNTREVLLNSFVGYTGAEMFVNLEP